MCIYIYIHIDTHMCICMCVYIYICMLYMYIIVEASPIIWPLASLQQLLCMFVSESGKGAHRAVGTGWNIVMSCYMILHYITYTTNNTT